MAETVLLNIEDHIAVISFNRPDKMNALNQTLVTELSAITEKVARDKNIRAVLLRGEGELFSAGGDVTFFRESLSTMPAGTLHLVRQVNAIISNLINMPKPILAAVHGAVAGVGISFMLAADLVIAGSDTQFNLAYTKIGVSPDGGATYLLTKILGEKKAMELILFSENFDANTAKDLGLINWIVPAGQLALEAQKILQRLASGPTRAYAKAKKLVRTAYEHTLPVHLEAEAYSFAKLSGTADFREGVTAFLEKRKAIFKGE